MKTELNNRILWFDGTNEVEAELVPELFAAGIQPDQLIVSCPNDDVHLFNQISENPLASFKDSNDTFDFSWAIPEKYLKLDLNEYIFELLSKSKYVDEKYILRVEAELNEIKHRKIENLFKTLIYIVDVFKMTDTIYGVGRGSSCASFILFLVGIHKVNSVMYDIPYEEFFHD